MVARTEGLARRELAVQHVMYAKGGEATAKTWGSIPGSTLPPR
jgi:hypothetical protein